MTDTVISQRLQRTANMANNSLDRLSNIVPDRKPGPALFEYLPQALQRAQQDPAFAAQLTESLQKYSALHKAVWGGSNGQR